jgi:hypothetical protein
LEGLLPGKDVSDSCDKTGRVPEEHVAKVTKGTRISEGTLRHWMAKDDLCLKRPRFVVVFDVT